MGNKNSSYRLQYYEDDVVTYTDSGKHPKLPEKYKTHTFYFKDIKHKLRSFYSKEQAEISVKYAKTNKYPNMYRNSWVADLLGYKIFYCEKCCMFHIASEKNYNKYIKHEQRKKMERWT